MSATKSRQGRVLGVGGWELEDARQVGRLAVSTRFWVDVKDACGDTSGNVLSFLHVLPAWSSLLNTNRMFRHKRANTLSHHITTASDGRALGRDDPLWERYVTEASKWDENWMKSWNESMESLLLFAALFSAIVTAFLIESQKGLNPDYGQLTASGMMILVELARVASGQTSTIEDVSLPSPLDFKPKKVSIVVNTLWFSSLTLSITTALLALLVKQWSEGYLFGNGLTTPCIQARIRQARYDKLRSWKTEEIVLSLPILMHAALWLFLLGLLIFLGDLHPTVLAPVMVFVLITFMLYLFTSLAPLAVAFCPYNTPLSGRKLWGLCHYWLSHQGDSDQDLFTPPCQKEEKELSERTTPDALTARAVEWLMKHSRDQTSVDIAIRAISSPMLEIQVWKSLAQGSLLALICQRFTSLLNGLWDKQESSHGPTNLLTLLPEELEEKLAEASIYARALSNIAKYTNPATFYSNGVTRRNTGPNLINLNEELANAVVCGLRQLAFDTREGNNLNIVAAGISSLSTWYNVIGRTSQTHREWKHMLIKLIEILVSTSQKNHTRQASQSLRAGEISHSNQPTGASQMGQTESLEDDAFATLVKVLPVEISHWKWELGQERSAEILKKLLELFASKFLSQNHKASARGGLAAAIAVLAIMVNDYPDPDAWLHLQSTDYDSDLAAAYALSEAAYDELREATTESRKARRRLWRAQWLASICTTDSKFLDKYTDAMLLLGLSGLLESFTVLRLSESTSQIAHIIYDRLNDLLIMKRSRPITLPFILPRTFDIRIYAVDTITSVLHPSLGNQLNPFAPQDQVLLLRCISGNKQLWVDCAPQLLLPVLSLLSTAEDSDLCEICLNGLEEYWHTHSVRGDASRPPYFNSRHDWKIFFAFDIPAKLIKLVHDEKLGSRALSSFRELTRIIPTIPTNKEYPCGGVVDSAAKDHVLNALKSIALKGLLPDLAERIIFQPNNNLTIWWRQILSLPRTLKLQDHEDARVLEALKLLSQDRELKGIGALVRSSLEKDLDDLQEELDAQARQIDLFS
ncbi:hypothetical protein OPQ81_006065 [Rhizoctonia solani]|nr:hypothetical protein OPQ81_006065 [Rhizoctonia solani]